jgi:glucose/arabinose dehydrogenase
MRRRSFVPFAIAALVGGLSAPQAAGASTTLPGFTDSVVWSATTPTDLTFAPDGRGLLTQDSGQLRVIQNGKLLATPAVSIASSQLCTNGERGLVGVTFDPKFTSNHFVYLFWTHNAHNSCTENTPQAPESRVVRYVLGSDNRARQAHVIVDHIPSPSKEHVAGDLHFGSDGRLYIRTGDGGCTIGDPTKCDALNTNSRRLDILAGKILRVNPDGTIPASNPYVGRSGAHRCGSATPSAGTGPCTETFASGLRNPYRFGKKLGTSTFFVNDTGQDQWEEVDNLVSGADYGWNIREGHCANGSTTDCGTVAGLTNPIFDYSHDDGCGAITGGTFVPRGVWPAPFDGAYIFGDIVCAKMFRLAPRMGGGFDRVDFLTGVNGPTTILFGPDHGTRSLYYLDFYGGKVHRVRHTG